jgi:carboxyl-terminal processing protease
MNKFRFLYISAGCRRKIVKQFCLFLALSVCFTAYVSAQDAVFKKTVSSLLEMVNQKHYAPVLIDDRFSELVFNNYLQITDPKQILFTKEDVRELSKFKHEIDDYLRSENFQFISKTEDLYEKRILRIDELLNNFKPEDFNFDEYDTLTIGGGESYIGVEDFESNLKYRIKFEMLLKHLSDNDSSKVCLKMSPAEKEACLSMIVAGFRCRLKADIADYKNKKLITPDNFLKALALAFDPHTMYLSQTDFEHVQTGLSVNQETYGLEIMQSRYNEIMVKRVIPGSAAWESNRINEGDIILNIKTESGEMFPFECIDLLQVANILTSPKYEKLTFSIEKRSGKQFQITLEKRITAVEDNAVNSYILEGEKRIGYLYFPAFYSDTDLPGYVFNGSADDLAAEIIKLKRNEIEGLIIDLRDNPGGSMREALKIAGFFIDYGALCIADFADGNAQVIKDRTRGTLFEKPIVVLVSPASASASELFAAVMQDYNRAVIVGERTYGKSSIQAYEPVYVGKRRKRQSPQGILTLTQGAFFRLNNKALQGIGVLPDIRLPFIYADVLQREADISNMLKFKDTDQKAYYTKYADLPVKKLAELSRQRVRNNTAFIEIQKASEQMQCLKHGVEIPLNFESFNQFYTESVLFNLKDFSQTKEGPIFYPKANKLKINVNSEPDSYTQMRISKDIYIRESYNILNDLIKLKKTN